MIFVFGSNLAGRHGKGAAQTALREYGAIYGQAHGLQGSSWGIPTKDENLKPLPLIIISEYVKQFLNYAASHPSRFFWVTPIGTGLAGYSHEQIAPMFKGYTRNVYVDPKWQEILSSRCGNDSGDE